MRSASSFAFFSASSKSMVMSPPPPIFLAPSLDVTFLAPRMLALRGPVVLDRSAAEVVMRLAAGLDSVSGPLASGDAARAPSLPFWGFRNGDGVRPTTGGVAVREMGGLSFLTAGLLHDEKKSSSSSAGVSPLSAPSPASLITTSSGYSLASLAALFLSSSLYLVAAADVYFVLGSLLLRAAEPPLDWKNLVADSLPPTFMTRSWSHCHSGGARLDYFV